MITFIMGYAKPEETLKYIHNRNLRYNYETAFGVLISAFKLL